MFRQRFYVKRQDIPVCMSISYSEKVSSSDTEPHVKVVPNSSVCVSISGPETMERGVIHPIFLKCAMMKTVPHEPLLCKRVVWGSIRSIPLQNMSMESPALGKEEWDLLHDTKHIQSRHHSSPPVWIHLHHKSILVLHLCRRFVW